LGGGEDKRPIFRKRGGKRKDQPLERKIIKHTEITKGKRVTFVRRRNEDCFISKPGFSMGESLKRLSENDKGQR